ncbi:MAG: hypothetical protein IPM48_09880 [Saprospiraceae bacterium]|nr:hypothetical protein [Saprospiraceae bacterium]
MKKTIIINIYLALAIIISSCSSDAENSSRSSSSSSNFIEEDESSNGCRFDDGTHSASVDYSNPETGYSSSYTLDVVVQDCQVIQINFPNDGYLDEDHISYADIDDDGNATVEGENGKTYEIHID